MALADKLKEQIQESAPLPSHQKLKDLNALSKAELENSLLKELLGEYQASLLQLKKEQDSSLQNLEKMSQTIEEKVNQLQNSNQMLNQNVKSLLEKLSDLVSKEIGTLRDNNRELLNGVRSDVNRLLTSKLDGVATETKSYINSLETLKEDSRERYNVFYDRWKIVDYLVIANLTIVPILLLVLSYMVFFKK